MINLIYIRRPARPAVVRAAIMGLVAASLLAGAAVTAVAQRRTRPGNPYAQYLGSPDEFYDHPAFHGNPPYDGRFTFARIKYRGYDHWSAREGPGWSHDYPDAEENFTKILRDISSVRPFVQAGPILGGAIVALDDPQLFRYPVSYMSEPGGWHPNDREIACFRAYFLKGGFMIFDDFREGWHGDFDWTHLQQIVAAALPRAKWVQLTGNEPIFHVFFRVNMQTAVPWPSAAAYGQEPPTYWGVYRDNDPKQRLMMIANVDNDIGESWQWSGTGFVPVAISNEAYKLGVNYIIYALTH